MIQRGQQVGLALEVAHDGAAHNGIDGAVDHFLNRYLLDNIREVQVAGPIYSAHPPDT